jgi:hypothetical protein
MRSASIPVLLLSAFACAAQPRLGAGELRASLLRENLLWIAGGQQHSESVVRVCLVSDPNRLIVDAAEKLAGEMFAKIRVRLQWHEPPVCPAGASDPVLLTLETQTVETHFPGALGAALPSEGSHAWVFYDRVLRAGLDDNYVAALLAHAMAHEIAHVLQGINRHSESGILKAHWSDTDCARMTFFPLMFTREDALLIHRGLKERHSRLVSNGSAGIPINQSDEIWARRERSLPVP